MSNDADVIVVGGGLAGLTAAATAARSGASVILLERAAPGGRARTAERDGFTFNFGAHALYRGGYAEAVLGRLGIKPSGVPSPVERYKLLFGDRLHTMPAGPRSLMTTTALGTRAKAQLAALLGRLPLMRPRTHAGVTVDEWVAEHDLRPDAEAVLRALIRISTYGADQSVLSADAVILQLQLAASKGVLYLEGGWSQLIDELRAGIDVRSGRVEAVRGDANGVAVLVGEQVLTARAAVVAAGTPEVTSELIEGGADWPGLGPANRVACLDAGVRRVPEPGYVLGVDEALFGTVATSSLRMAPAGMAAVGVVRYGTSSAAEDRADCERWLGHMGVAEDDVVVSRFMPHVAVTAALPTPDAGGMAGRPAVDATGVPNVFIAGDWVGPDGFLSDASFASGEAAGLAASRVIEHAATMVA